MTHPGPTGDSGLPPEPLPTPARGTLTALLTELGGEPAVAPGVERSLLRRWREPHRHYHDSRHLAEVLARVAELAEHARSADLVRVAAWWHDAVHQGRAGADEEASAQLAQRQLTEVGLAVAEVAEVVRLVRLTAGHEPEPGDADGEVLCDADLGILAAPPARYGEYARDVRAEYAWVPEPAFRAGRAALLRGLLARDRLYRTPTATGWEPAARRNLSAELARLTDGPT